jgi:hypothetical protein
MPAGAQQKRPGTQRSHYLAHSKSHSTREVPRQAETTRSVAAASYSPHSSVTADFKSGYGNLHLLTPEQQIHLEEVNTALKRTVFFLGCLVLPCTGVILYGLAHIM